MYAWDSDKLLVSYAPQHPLYSSKHKRRQFIDLIDRLRAQTGDKSELVLRDYPPIWFRDWLPVQTSKSFILFRVATDYMTLPEASEVQHHQMLLRNFSPSQLETLLQSPKPIRLSDIILDGGNVVMDDRHVIISSKIYRDNPGLASADIQTKLTSIFEGRKLIFIDAEPDDPTGHADGQYQFFAEGLLLGNDLSAVQPDIWQSNLRKLSKLDIQLELIPYAPTDKVVAGWPVMNGNYINFAATHSDIILPSYGDRTTEDNVRAVLNKVDPLKRSIHFLRTGAIDRLGGGLHCITWNA